MNTRIVNLKRHAANLTHFSTLQLDIMPLRGRPIMTTHHFDSSHFISDESIPSIYAQLDLPNTGDANQALVQRFFRTQFFKLFNQIKHGRIQLNDPYGTFYFGDNESDLKCIVTIYNIDTYQKIALGGSNGSGQAYIDGLWSSDNPTNLIRILIRNRKILESMESGLSSIMQTVYKVWHAFNRNSKKGSQKNIAAHYDLGNDFFKLFLDQRMMYSSALYQQGDTLESASKRKLDRICKILELSANDHVIEIGSGWGGFACYAAQTTGCKVTTVTISKEQYQQAVKTVQALGLEALVTVKLQDYRDIKGTFNKLVSIEMIEAVGHQYVNSYFQKIHQLLSVGGKALLQSIVIDDAQYERALKEVDYIKRYIFPGCFIPSYSVIANSAGQHGLMLENLHDMGLSYAQTLRDWRKRFYQQRQLVDAQGYDERFQRMWEFYLCYCEGGFDEQAISVGQLLFRKQANTA